MGLSGYEGKTIYLAVPPYFFGKIKALRHLGPFGYEVVDDPSQGGHRIGVAEYSV